ncbi:PEP/pyruvate-binding domain-containing protein [Kitasatospora sp. NPDC059327]|uniref:PEP/pyruvate-binding domain-containing protein n=1 Tax=Kitasatospora sp. NPDC059327 TaxID=3346803 RepID=UPI003675BFE8
MTHTPALLRLQQAFDLRHAGGKAAALARLHHAGIPVPDSLVIPADTTDDQLHATADAIERWARHRAPHGLIARSSATTEDGQRHSFAGLYLSCFTPTDHAPLLDAVHAVRASATSTTAAAYATRQGIDGDVRMAVLVQPALCPAVSGVLAAEVAAGRCTTWRIEAVHGLAEQLVGGEATGEVHSGGSALPVTASDQQFVLLPGTPAQLRTPPGEWLVLDTLNGPVRAKVQTSGQGLLRLHLPRSLAATRILTGLHRDALLGFAVRAANALGVGQVDVEWTIGPNGSITIVQARPLTAALTPAAAPTPSTDAWRGHPAVAGTASGPAVHLVEGDPRPGAVVICEALGPEAAGALLNGPAAIVATRGGPLSHTAIIARELGIPCVTNLREARTVAADTVLLVDGSAGTVRPATGVPAQRTAPPPPPVGAAAVTTRLPAASVANAPTVTLVIHDPHDGPLSGLLDRIAASTAPGAVGVLLIDEDARIGTVRRFETVDLPGAGRLLWPAENGSAPAHLVVLGPDGNVIHQRAAAAAGGAR